MAFARPSPSSASAKLMVDMGPHSVWRLLGHLRQYLSAVLIFVVTVIFVVHKAAVTSTANNSELSQSSEASGAVRKVKDHKSAPKNEHNQTSARILVLPVIKLQTRLLSTVWWKYLSGYALFLPFLWPSKSRRLQINAGICILLTVSQRLVNLLVPIQMGIITTSLIREEVNGVNVYWSPIFTYAALEWFQGAQGLLSAIRTRLWTPVSQHIYKELSIAAFEHAQNLNLDFHLHDKGEVLSTLGDAEWINAFLDQIMLQFVPMLAEIFIAFVYFSVAFDGYCALLAGLLAFGYISVTLRTTEWRANSRRQIVDASKERSAVLNDSLNFETIAFFGGEKYESRRYRRVVHDVQQAEEQLYSCLSLSNACESTVFNIGRWAIYVVAAYQVSICQRPVGQFVTILTYVAELRRPLDYFSTLSGALQQSFIRAERMLKLFRQQPAVSDGPTAQPLEKCAGGIQFDRVNFSYSKLESPKPNKMALNEITFHCAPGTTTALVGGTGEGKSTVLGLLFRFYNPHSGRICVDDRDVRDITIESLRKHIGVVPQDPVLFNNTVMYNLKYAKRNATDEEIHAACRAARIHDSIMAFPEGYNKNVGVRGSCLSGGERQRLAIACVLLKDPRIILLDEATAALDTRTEEHIQASLKELAVGRTVIIVAHRLSTVINADQILVVHKGQVAESGTHTELLDREGLYADMWERHIGGSMKHN